MKYFIITLYSHLFLEGAETPTPLRTKLILTNKSKPTLLKTGIECERSTFWHVLYKVTRRGGQGADIIYKDVVSFKYKGDVFRWRRYSTSKKNLLEFHVRQLIGAWKEIMLEMKEGSMAFLVAPPFLGYGAHTN